MSTVLDGLSGRAYVTQEQLQEALQQLKDELQQSHAQDVIKASDEIREMIREVVKEVVIEEPNALWNQIKGLKEPETQRVGFVPYLLRHIFTIEFSHGYRPLELWEELEGAQEMLTKLGFVKMESTMIAEDVLEVWIKDPVDDHHVEALVRELNKRS